MKVFTWGFLQGRLNRSRCRNIFSVLLYNIYKDTLIGGVYMSLQDLNIQYTELIEGKYIQNYY